MKKEEEKIADLVKTSQENEKGNTNRLKIKTRKENCEFKCLSL
jgi:hypothetical protein